MPSMKRNGKGVARFWRGLDEYAGGPEIEGLLEREFPAPPPEGDDPETRRTFLKLMGASIALAGMTGCRFPRETIVPFTDRPAGRIPGVPVRYATAFELGGAAIGVLVTSYDGRPIKIEGNPDHPASRGGTDAIAQASILGLYDPDRSRSPLERAEGGAYAPRSWRDFKKFATAHFEELRGARGEGLAILSAASSSPSLAAMRRRLLDAMPQARWYEYEPISFDAEREATRRLFGRPLRSVLEPAAADVLVCLDADLIGEHPDRVRLAREIAKRRRGEDGSLSRVYALEPGVSLTGALADHRLAVRPSRLVRLVWLLAHDLLVEHGLLRDLPGEFAGALAAAAEAVGKGPEREFVLTLAHDLAAHRGRALVVAGPRLPAAVHALAALANHALGAVGRTVAYVPDPDPDRPDHLEAIGELAERMAAGKVGTLLVLGGNPAYDAPADLDFPELLAKVPVSIHLGESQDETGRACRWHVNRAHYLESWGDARSWDGTVSVVQPLIEPLFGGKSPLELLALAAGDEAKSAHAIVRRTFAENGWDGGSETGWRRALHDGLVPSTAWPREAPAPRIGGLAEWIGVPEAAEEEGGIELVLSPDPRLWDGRFANIGWLQELPEPVTKLTWDNALLLGVQDAARLGVETGDVLRVTANGRSIELPAYVLPGQAPGAASVWLGFGRRAAGRVGDGVGADAYRLRTRAAAGFVSGVEVAKTGRREELAVTQLHWAIDARGRRERGRRAEELIREATIEHYREHPDFAKHMGHHPPLVSLFSEPIEYDGYKWGMAIDLAACTGCNACVVACQAENNIPVVGKREVINGREMHWIRVDRYFKGSPESPELAFQPVTCQQCENAPCEQVCPVAATVHSAEGLNQMVYNRCIGTRYCSNNCPYKVRRFNFFNNWKHVTPLEAMQHNPEVTLRSRGVMEKCTFCVQRIEAARHRAKLDPEEPRRRIRDGEVVPACAQACPTQAIVFGDLNDPESRVSRMHAHHRAYPILAELNVRPRNVYLAKLKNPVPDTGGTEHA
ncbi:MAG: 4Fe-4S dicluster domain-containing protein [Acidobacteria bacterium]|nr:MAG: 4Fe-4S dicluster domain-containing protein [Acidobacteriota bacterium]